MWRINAKVLRVWMVTVSSVFVFFCLIRQAVFAIPNVTLPSIKPPEYATEQVTAIPVPKAEGGQQSPKIGSALTETEPILFISTLDGALNAVSQTTGKIIWTLNEDPVLKTPVTIDRSPMFLTNPKDGSLYTFSLGFENLKKLPFTIPDLVTASPCRSSDGILYTGYKKDTWFVLDPVTGKKLQVLDMEGLQQEVCPSASDGPSLLIGRTEYSLAMFDGTTRQIRWNATFMDYSAHVTAEEGGLADYDLRHFASSSGGAVVTVDDSVGNVLWTEDFRSPVVAIYTLDAGRGLRKIPFVSVAGETLEQLTGRVTSNEWRERFLEHGRRRGSQKGSDSEQDHQFYPTLYIGEQASCFYALPSIVDGSTVMVVKRGYRPLLIEGPGESTTGSGGQYDARGSAAGGYLLLGYHEEPEMAEVSQFSTAVAARQIVDKSLPDSGMISTPDKIILDSSGVKINKSDGSLGVDDSTVVVLSSTALVYLLTSLTSVAVLISISILFRWSKSKPSQSETLDGMISVGAIRFDPTHVIGHGCDGTFVYRGTFDGREVAVKRMLRHCFTMADREVALLRESDQHRNVVRYYVTERDAQFCYIALELCDSTLQDYVKRCGEAYRGSEERGGVAYRGLEERGGEAVRLVQEALCGLAHLHSLNIVHRDVKPNNVLLSKPDSSGNVRAMISDFGLCKKLSAERHSLSKRSGVTGTDGWIAPEMLQNEGSVTQAVDIFSAGCLIYYTLTGGRHPFGDVLSRQANIMDARRDLSALSQSVNQDCLARDLVDEMTAADPTARPSSSAVLKHPLFWNTDRTLAFLEAVSDKVEKHPDASPEVLRLESGAIAVVRTDWTALISEELREDLRRFRSYKKYSVRDLLRAIRNKRHHFRELDPRVKASLGETVPEFVEYFTSRFPRLVTHTYDAMRHCCEDFAFTSFY